MCKKILVIALLSVPLVVGAVEGTCSSHGGVDCRAGVDWDGSAVCMDGWRDSSETFSSVQMCKIGLHYCTEAESKELNSKYGVEVKIQKLNEIYSQLEPYKQKSLSGTLTRADTIEILRLNSLQAGASNELNYAMSQVERECYSLGASAYYRSQAEFYKQLQFQPQSTPQYYCPANLLLSGNACVCPAGTVYNGNSCITYTQSCQVQLGQNSFGDANHCYCSTGFSYSNNPPSCVKTVATPSTPAQTINKPPEQTLLAPKASNSPEIKPKTKVAESIGKSPNVEAPKERFWVRLWRRIRFW